MTYDPKIRNSHVRFNLRMLDRVLGSILPREQERSFRISRRSFLGLSALVTLKETLPRFWNHREFAIARDGEVLHIALDPEHRWTIDPRIFGDSAIVEYTRAPDLVRIALRNGFFPGTSARADFNAVLRKVEGVWKISIRLLRGTTFRSELIPWLRRMQAAEAKWASSSLDFIPGLQLRVPRNALVQFMPDWTWRIGEPVEAVLPASNRTLRAKGALIQLLPAGAGESLAEGRGHRTVVKLERHHYSWPIGLTHVSHRGWQLDHDENIFDTVHVEAMATGDQQLHTAVFRAESSSASSLTFAPGGELRDSLLRPAELRLRAPRMLLDLKTGASLLAADLSETSTWVHGGRFSFEVGSSDSGPDFQLFQSGSTGDGDATAVLQTRVTCLCVSAGKEASLRLEPGGQLTSHWTWSNLNQPVERALGWLHVSFWENYLRFDLTGSDRFRLLRYRDQLNLSFACENMSLRLPLFGQPVLHRRDKKLAATITAIFPPQHVTEQAYFTQIPVPTSPTLPVGAVETTDKGITQAQLDPETTPSSSDELHDAWKLSDPNNIPRKIAAGPSQLVFTIDHQEIPFTVEGLLDWSSWTPKLADVAKTDATEASVPQKPVIYPVSDVADTHPSPHAANVPAEDHRYTAIELPWKLYLSPSDRENWQHESQPADHETGIYELWHSRLGLVHPLNGPATPQAAQVTDQNTGDVPVITTGLTARAIWTDDLTNGIGDKLDEHYPTVNEPGYRTTLDARDRQEIVHLTANFAWLEPSVAAKGKHQGAHPVDVEHLMLTPMGGYLRSFGAWNPGKLDDSSFDRQLTVEQWRHIATLGRDHYVRVVYKGYLLPFGHRSSLVKVTERRFVAHPATKVVYAVLQQHMYITVGKKDRDYPLLAQPWGGRNLGFDRIEALTLRTPDLQDPAKLIRPDSGGSQSQSLFWPCVLPGEPFQFNFRFYHKDQTYSDALAPVAFVGADLAQSIDRASDAVDFYNYGSTVKISPPTLAAAGQSSQAVFDLCVPAETLSGNVTFAIVNGPSHSVSVTAGSSLANIASAMNALHTGVTAAANSESVMTVTGPPGAGNDLNFLKTKLVQSGQSPYLIANPWRRSDFNEKKVEFAPSLKSGDTEFDTESIHWRAEMSVQSGTSGATDLAKQLYESDLPYFHPVLHQARVTSASTKRISPSAPATTVSFYPPYIEQGFDPKSNRGEVFLQVIGEAQELSFGGSNQSVDKSGGVVNPDILVVGFSRATGPVGGRRSDVDTASSAIAATLNPLAKSGTFSKAASIATVTSSQSSLSIHANGSFDPMSFFGGLASARILGGLKLSDVVAPLLNAIASDLGKAPQMLEQLLFDAETKLDDLETTIVGLIDTVQKLNFTLPGGTAQYPFKRRLAPQAQAVDDAYALRVANANGQDAIADALLHTQVISAIIQYGEALKKLVGDPVQFAEDTFLAALTDLLGSAYNDVLTALNGYAAELLAAIQAQAETTLNQLASALSAYADAVAKRYLDPIVKDLTDTADINTVFRQMEPELAAVLEIAPVVDDLLGRIQQLPDYASDPIRLMENIPLALDDALTIAERLGVLNAVQAADLTAAATNVQQQAITAYKVAVDLAHSPVQAIIDASWIFAEELSKYTDPTLSAETTIWIDRGRQALQAVNQLRQSATQFGQTLTFRPGTSTDLEAWADTQFRRRMQANILAALQTLHTSALECLQQVPSGPLSSAATALLNAFGDATQANWLGPILTTVDTLDQLADAIEVVRKNTKTVLDAEQQLLMLGYQQSKTLSSSISALRTGNLPAFERANQILAGQAQLFMKTLELQAPFAVAFAYQFYSSNVDELRTLQSAASSLITWFNAIADKVCTQLADFYSKWDALNTFLNGITGAEIALLQVIESQLGIVRDSFAAYKADLPTPPPPGCPISSSQALYHMHQTLAAVNGLVHATQQGISNLGEDGKVIVETAKQMLSQLLGLIPPAVKVRLSFDWHPKLKSFEPVFLLRDNADLTIQAEAVVPISLTGPQTPPSFNTTGTLTNFSINLIGSPSFIIVDIDSFQFTAVAGNRPDVHLKINNVRFGEDMQFIEELRSLLNPQDGPFLDFIDGGVSAGFRFHVPSIQVGAFSIMQLSLNVAVMLPFNGDPARCIFGISEQDHPFLLTVSIYGGGGFLQLRLGLDGVELLEGALEFGIVAGISIGPLNGWGYCVAGIYFRIEASRSRVCGFVHAHGHMDVLGIISMDIDLKVTICYLSAGTVQGDADFEVDIDILFFSASYTFHATYQFGGSPASAPALAAARSKLALVTPPARSCTVPQIDRHRELTPELWDQYLRRFSFAA